MALPLGHDSCGDQVVEDESTILIRQGLGTGHDEIVGNRQGIICFPNPLQDQVESSTVVPITASLRSRESLHWWEEGFGRFHCLDQVCAQIQLVQVEIDLEQEVAQVDGSPFL